MRTLIQTDQSRWLDSLIEDSRRHALPILTSPGMALIEKRADEVFRSGELQFQVIHALTDRFPMAAALTMMDLSVEAEAFGAPVKFTEQENPNIVGTVVETLEAIEKLPIPAVGSARTSQCLLAAELCVKEIRDRPTLGGLIGPFSLAGRLLDMSRMMYLTAAEPTMVHALLEKTTSFLIDYAKAFKKTGCGGLIMAEPAAGLVSPKMSRVFSYDYIGRIVKAVKDDNFVFVLHNCGKTEKMVPEMLSTGASALHVGNAVDITKILDQTPREIPVMGNIDPSGLFLMGKPEEVFAATTALLERTKAYPHFVLSSGCDIPPGTRIENIQAFFDALAENGRASRLSTSLSF